MKKSFDEIDEAALFHEGIELFNDGEWFEAHETWEDIWRLASGARKLFYQGLIQCAVTLEHARRGNPRGVRSIWTTCTKKFEGLENVYLGINIGRLLSGVELAIRPILDLPAEHFSPGRGRGQELPIDWNLVPRIELAYEPFGEKGERGEGGDKERG